MARWKVACDACDASAWIGPRRAASAGGTGPALVDRWCERCQHALADTPEPAEVDVACPQCGAVLTAGAPRFVEAWGEIQSLDAVLAAWARDPAPLAALLPERPRFLSDRNPPEPAAHDAPALREALAHLRSGDFTRARRELETLLARGAQSGLDPVVTFDGRRELEAALVRGAERPSDSEAARAWHALAIACERMGDNPAAEAACTRSLEREESESVRLERGVLRAGRRDLAGAREDFALAGAGHEARWNRAALKLIEAVAANSPTALLEGLAAARAEGVEPSSYWSDFTVGRLAFTLVFERERARAHGMSLGDGARAALQQAEAALEFDTFWDRALVLHAFTVLRRGDDARRVAQPLAEARAADLGTLAFLAAPRAADIATALARARAGIAAGGPLAARAPLVALLARQDLRRFGIPCARCASGTVGLDEVEEDETAE